MFGKKPENQIDFQAFSFKAADCHSLQLIKSGMTSEIKCRFTDGDDQSGSMQCSLVQTKHPDQPGHVRGLISQALRCSGSFLDQRCIMLRSSVHLNDGLVDM